MEQHEYMSLIRQLKERFHRCHDEYMKELSELDKERIIESAAEIVAVKDVYLEMRFWLEMSMCQIDRPIGAIKGPIESSEAATLLELENPLKELAAKWWIHVFCSKPDFHDFYKMVMESRCRSNA